jgi:hypothetical protein
METMTIIDPETGDVPYRGIKQTNKTSDRK